MTDLELIHLLTNIIKLQSFNPLRSELPEYIISVLNSYKIPAKIIESNGYKNIVASTPGQAKLLLNGHWDTVLPAEKLNIALQNYKNDNTYIHGLGACDMKSGVASMIAAFIECYKNNIPGIVLCLVGDEELGGENGTKVLVIRKILAPNVILGEPTNLRLSMGQKSAFTMEVYARGKSAHAAYPFRGENAILKATAFITRVNKIFKTSKKTLSGKINYRRTTASLDLISGGSASNVVPAECKLTYDVRFPPFVESETIKKIFNELAQEMSVEIRYLEEGNGWIIDKTSKLFKTANYSIAKITGSKPELIYKMGTNDGKYYGTYNCNIINIGPGDNALSHTLEEKVKIDEVITAKKIYTNIAASL